MYLGNNLQVAFPSYTNIDDISGSFNGSTTSFALTVNGSAPVPFPLSSNQCLISVNGVVQRPDDSGTEGFRLSGGNIIFSSAPGAGQDFFGVILAGADYVNVGVNYPSGSSTTPSITFETDLDTGLYNPGANQVGITCGTTTSTVFTATGYSFLAGSAAAPGLYPAGDTNTGLYSPGSDQLTITTGGTARLNVEANGTLNVANTVNYETLVTTDDDIPNKKYVDDAIAAGSITFPLLATSLGSVTAPTYSFSADTNTGIYSPGADQLSITTGGTARLNVETNGTLNVAGTTNYESLVTADDDIPNKKYVDDAITAGGVSFPLLATSDGSAAAPAYSFTSDTDTGIFRATTDTLALAAGGTSRLEISSSSILSNLRIIAPAGSNSSPSYIFAGSPTTGIYSPGANQLAITTDGTARATVSSTGTVTLTGDVAFSNTKVTALKTATFNSQVNLVSTSGTINIDWTAAQNYRQPQPTSTITYTFTNPPGPGHFQLFIDNTSTAQTINWPGYVIFMGSTWSGENNKRAVLNFWYDGSSTYLAIGTNQA